MKTALFILKVSFPILFLVSFSLFRSNPASTPNEITKSSICKGTAIVITGAAARIPQEVALLEQLYNTGELKDVTFISGASSGALNAVILNAILSDKFSWNRYKNILFAVTPNQIFNKNNQKLPLDTKPLHRLLLRIVNDSIGYYKIGDLPIPTALSATHIELTPLRKRTFRFSNVNINSESNPDFNLVDILKASTAIPVIFPSVDLSFMAYNRPITCIDGGIGEDQIPYQAALQYQLYTGIEFEKLIIISRKTSSEACIGSEFKHIGLNDTKMLSRIEVSLQKFSREGFIKKLHILQQKEPGLASRTYVYIPDFEQDYPLLNFSNFKEQFATSAAWAKANKPVPLKQYLEQNETKSILNNEPIPVSAHD